MSTDLDMANMALGLIGQDTVSSLTPPTSLNNKVVNSIVQFLPAVKEGSLRARDWHCARKRAALAAVANESMDEWRFAYATPDDCLAVRRMVDDRRWVTGWVNWSRSPFAWEVRSDGKRILYTNVENAKIVYTANITDVNRWDRLLFNAATGLLASRLGSAFSRDIKLAEKFLQDAFREFDEAVGVDEAESTREQETSTDFTDVRLGGNWFEGPTNVIR